MVEPDFELRTLRIGLYAEGGIMDEQETILKIIGAIAFFFLMQWLWRNFFKLFGRKSCRSHVVTQPSPLPTDGNDAKRRTPDTAITDSQTPPDILRSINSYRDWNFDGQELSPLTCFGYRVGKSNGRPQKIRHEILEYALVGQIPTFFPAAYIYEWGEPRSLKRYNRIIRHLKSQADSREKSNKDYSVAIEEWRSDARWFQDNYYLPHRR